MGSVAFLIFQTLTLCKKSKIVMPLLMDRRTDYAEFIRPFSRADDQTKSYFIFITYHLSLI